MNISDDLAFNIVKDWEKRSITPEEKSEFLKEYLKITKISQRGLARKLGISHSTLHDWVSMRQVYKAKALKESESEYSNEDIVLHDWDSARELKSFKDRKFNELEVLASRLLFVLSKSKELTPKGLLLINQLKNEIEVKLR